MTLLFRCTTCLFFLTLIGFVATPASAQERDHSQIRESPNAQVSQTIGTTQIDVYYGRPGVRDREIFGGLVPWGEPWRAGANEPTTVVFSDNVQVEGEELEADTYNFFIRPHESGAWDVILTTPVRWGTMFDEATPVLTVQVAPEEGPHQEWLQFHFEDLSDTSGVLVMHWAETKLPVTITTTN